MRTKPGNNLLPFFATLKIGNRSYYSPPLFIKLLSLPGKNALPFPINNSNLP